MKSFLAGTGIGTLFVNHQLRITRFTPASAQVLNLIQGHVERPGNVPGGLVSTER